MNYIRSRFDPNAKPEFVKSDVSAMLATYEAFRGEHDKMAKHLVLAGGVLRGSNIDISWLPAAADTYKISADPDDFLLVDCPIVTCDCPNRNMQCFDTSEAAYFDPLYGKQLYKTFIGKPTHVDHCFAAGTVVRMADGSSKPIEQIQVDDLVLTHTGASKRVTKLFRNGGKSVTRLRAVGTLYDLLVTENHPVFVVDKRQVFGARNPISGGRSSRHRFKDFRDRQLTPHWRPVSDIYHGDYLCMPIQFGGDIAVDPAFAFLVGAFLADGSFGKRDKSRGKQLTETYYYGMTFTIGDHELEFREKIVACLAQHGIKAHVTVSASPGTTAITAHSVALAKRMLACTAEYSEQKRMRGEVRHWNRDAIKVLLGGYISGDGCFDKKKCAFRIRSSSQDLLRDSQQALAFLGIPSCIGIDSKVGSRGVAKVKTKYGREVSIIRKFDSGCVRIPKEFMAEMAPFVVGKSVVVSESAKDTVRTIIHNEMILTPIDNIERDAGEVDVFNFEVEDDNSYVAGDVIVHNCNQDPTKAKGVIFDAAMEHIPEYDIWKIRILAGFDRTKDPFLCNQIITGKRPGFSMGCLVQSFVCSICGAIDTQQNPCRHMSQQLGTSKGMLWDVQRDCPVKPNEAYGYAYDQIKLVYQSCAGCNWIETSSVSDPADTSATISGTSNAIWIP